MVRVIVGGVVGGVILFFWGFLSWVILPWHNYTFDQAPDEVKFGTVLSAELPTTGTYLLPMIPVGQMNSETQATFTERYSNGPVAIVHIRKEPRAPMPPQMFAIGIVLNIAMALCASAMLWMVRGAGLSYAQRLLLVMLAGLFTAIASYGIEWNWLVRTDFYTLVNIADVLVGTLLMALAIAAIVPGRAVPSEPK